MEATEAEPAAEPALRPTRRVISLVPLDGREPPATLDEAEAEGAWAAISAPWHPAILARIDALPQVVDAGVAQLPEPGDVLVLAAGAWARLPSGDLGLAEALGPWAVEGLADRVELSRRLLAKLDPEASSEVVGEPDGLTLDFYALGTARRLLKELTIAMGHIDCLDHEALTRETLGAAVAHREGDHPGATNRLRAAFELLTRARERFYPVDAYLLDICLLDVNSPAGSLAAPLAAHTPFTILGTARAIEAQASADPDALRSLRDAISEGWADVVGGTLDEADEGLLPVESILRQFRRGAEVYRDQLDHRNVETLASRRFALYPQRPQVARRFGFRFAMHVGLDDGRFPVRPEAKRLWEAPDGTSLESLTRPPTAADRASDGPRLPWRLATTMRDDHVATLPIAHWPGALAGWALDLARAAAYSPVFARRVTLSDYFHLTDRPFETFRPTLDEYTTPYLAQAVARRDEAPISRRARHARLRARLDALDGLRSLGVALRAIEPEDGSRDLEDAVETGTVIEADLTGEDAAIGALLARAVGGDSDAGRPGYLAFNPWGIARRAAILLPDAAPELRPEGPLRASQLAEEGVWAVVDLPAFGYAWIPAAPDATTPPAPAGVLSVRERVLRNEAMTVEIDATSGGIRAIRGPGEDIARLGQQLVMTGLPGGPSRMQLVTFEVDYAGPALAQAVSKGEILDAFGRRLARFEQRYRLWSGRPALEVDISISELDLDWLALAEYADPWDQALSCRWAWPDAGSTLRRTSLLAPFPTDSPRPETPDAVEIATRQRRTLLLFGGLAHHRKQGARMLDTLLIAGRESARSFRLGVALDLEHPHQAALDLIAPSFAIPTRSGPPAPGPTGWFLALDNKAVAVTSVAPLPANPDEGRGPGLAFHLVETAGRAARCRLRLLRDPVEARQVDFHGELIADLPIDRDAVLVDLTPHEIARVEVTFAPAHDMGENSHL